VSADSKARTFEALALVAEHDAVSDQVEGLRRAPAGL
jgi:hypothetical protein